MGKKSYINKLVTASSIFVILIFLLWNQIYPLGCFALIIPLVVIYFITSSFVDLQMHKRRSIRNYYFVKETFISNFLSSKKGTFVVFFVYSIILSVSTLYGAIEFRKALWLYLIIHIPLCTILFLFLKNKFSGIIKPEFINVFSRETTIKISAVLLFVIYFFIFIFGFEPEYLKDDLKETLKAATAIYSSNCEIIDMALRVKVEIDSIFWWISDKVAGSIESTESRKSFWLIIFLINCLAVIGLNRFVVQVIYWWDLKFCNGREE